MYQLDAEKKALEFVSEIKSVRADDGPRHAVVSADGERLYVVTEHSQSPSFQRIFLLFLINMS